MKRSETTQAPSSAATAAGRAGAATVPSGAAVSGAAVASGARAGARRRYVPPRLECHGRLAEVTRFGGSEIVDSGGGLGQQF